MRSVSPVAYTKLGLLISIPRIAESRFAFRTLSVPFARTKQGRTDESAFATPFSLKSTLVRYEGEPIVKLMLCSPGTVATMLSRFDFHLSDCFESDNLTDSPGI